jgi:hypothetical protein
MQGSVKALLVGAAAVATAIAVHPAIAQDGQEHVLAITLPGGGVEEIHDTGDVAPQVVWAPNDGLIGAKWVDPAFGWGATFAAMERLNAAFAQQEAALLRDVAALSGTPHFALPPGATGYSVVQTITGNGVCTQTTQISYMGNGIKPRTVSSSTGDCGASHAGGLPANLPSPSAPSHTAPAVRTWETKAASPHVPSNLVQVAAWHPSEPKTD